MTENFKTKIKNCANMTIKSHFWQNIRIVELFILKFAN